MGYSAVTHVTLGTFSTVYKAEDLDYDKYQNDWDLEEKENAGRTPPNKNSKRRHKPHYVAIKKIYVTSSPQRIMNELDLLHDLRHCRHIAPLITAFRDKDQVIAILPYFQHRDFRTYFRDFNASDVRIYFRSLFAALSAVHQHKILHRDVKPTNFLYDIHRKRGVLIDFGLAERQGTDHQPCICELQPEERSQRIRDSYHRNRVNQTPGYPKGDQRPSLRANRAGTRGFRAPEVLFKCTAQTTKIDVWSAGIVLLTILCRRFPFFNSADDVDAVIELMTIFGKTRMRKCAISHGQVLETNIPSVGDNGFTLASIVIWSQDRPTRDKTGNKTKLRPDEVPMVEFLQRCLELDPQQRISAEEALEHPFLVEKEEEGSEDEMDILQLG